MLDAMFQCTILEISDFSVQGVRAPGESNVLSRVIYH